MMMVVEGVEDDGKGFQPVCEVRTVVLSRLNAIMGNQTTKRCG